MLRKIFVILVVIASTIPAQTDWIKWEAKSVSYEIETNQGPWNVVSTSGTDTKIISAAKSVYKFMFSDLDGNNCPFHPSCSQFYVEAVKETDLLKGTLMFIDRFTRDVNFFKGLNHYPVHSSGKFFDPAYNYCLDLQKINLQLPDKSTN